MAMIAIVPFRYAYNCNIKIGGCPRFTTQEWQQRLTKKQREELKAWYKQYAWHPHQLRHNAATFLRKEFGLETAASFLATGLR